MNTHKRNKGKVTVFAVSAAILMGGGGGVALAAGPLKPFPKDGKWGFVDKDMNIVVPPPPPPPSPCRRPCRQGG